jgi:hypothetical protein
MPKKIDIASKSFKGEHRDVSTVKRLFDACETCKDVELFPAGRVTKRKGYVSLYNSIYVYKKDPNDVPPDVAQPAVLPVPHGTGGIAVYPDKPDPGGAITPWKSLGDDIGGGVLLKIKAVHHYPMMTSHGIEKRHVAQMTDERLYKYSFGNHAGWVALENTYIANPVNVDPAVDEWWWRRLLPIVTNGGLGLATHPVSEVRARFTDHNGVLRAGLGLGAGKTPIWYDWIDRYYFTNGAGNKYTDNFLDVTPLQPPRKENVYSNAAEADWRLKKAVNTHDVGRLNDALVDINMFNDIITWNPDVALEDLDKLSPFIYVTLDVNGDVLDYRWYNGQEKDTQVEVIRGERNLMHFFVGMSYMYDNYQESQIHVLENSEFGHYNETVHKGGIIISQAATVGMVSVGDAGLLREIGGYITVALRQGKMSLESVDANGYPDKTNNRITGVRLWLAKINNKKDKPEDLFFYPVKRISASRDELFDNEKYLQGEHVWALGTDAPAGFSSNYYHYIAVIDASDWEAGLASGDAATVMGHSLYLEDTEKKLNASPFLESYRYAEVVGGTHYYAGVRIGVFKPQENAFAMTWATRFSDTGGGTQGATAVTPDVINPELSYVCKAPIQNIRALDSRTLAIVTDNGVINFDTTYSKVEDAKDGGCTSPDSVFTEEKGVILYRNGELSRYDGVNQYPISTRIQKSDDTGTYKGLEDAHDHTTVQAFFSKKLAKLFVFVELAANVWTTFVYDYSAREWIRYNFYHQFVCGCVGVDGELDFSDGTYIYRHPLGLDDAGQVIAYKIKSSDANWDSRAEMILDQIYMYVKSTTSSVKVSIYRDRGTTPVVVTIAAQTVWDDVLANVNVAANRAKNTISVQIESTTPSLTEVVEIEKINVTNTPVSRVS